MLSAYSATCRRWKLFNVTLGFCFNSPPESTNLRFLCSLFEENISQISKVLAGISFFFKIRHFPACSSLFSLQQAVKSYKHSHMVLDDHRPITFETLQKLTFVVLVVCYSYYEALLFRALFVVFFVHLRLSEIVPRYKKRGSGLLFHHVVVGDCSVKIIIAKSKTDQLGKCTWLTLFPCSDSICLVSVICHFLSRRPSSPGKFFLHENGYPVTKFLFVFSDVISYVFYGCHIPSLSIIVTVRG